VDLTHPPDTPFLTFSSKNLVAGSGDGSARKDSSLSVSMRSLVVFASVAALLACTSALARTSSTGRSSWKFSAPRSAVVNPCMSAIQSVLNCTGSWSGGSEPPFSCCGPMTEAFAQCGDGSVFPTVVRVLNEADVNFGPNATLPIMSLVGFCPRASFGALCLHLGVVLGTHPLACWFVHV
jgi:hypothetical protein